MFAFSAFDQIPEQLSKGPKELFVVDGVTHIAPYDVPKYVDQAIPKMAEFFAVL
ncbi:hypothetical protein TUSST3_40450 [Streptomyces sp. TUS-ST3]|uniref:hypothetical protein n=1 Tax=Streptomyces sp. TUS-ST3 TaxID=3025591 RepID=UPI00235B3DB1|nr:hypothetical protein [Streptomyces sp. TUS-ST3]GLP67423.1 hypothetical protein TUSST3_40450 [Streptomyces sp. TUS-ST3]